MSCGARACRAPGRARRNFEAADRSDLQRGARTALSAQFHEIGDKLLEKAHKDFLDKAGERFTEADKASQAKLQTLLQPVEATAQALRGGAAARSRRSASTIMPAFARRSSWSARGRGRSATRPATWSMRCAPRPRRAAAGASRAFERARAGRPEPPMPISGPKCRSIRRGRRLAARRGRPPARRAQADHRRQMLAERLSRRLRRGRRRQARGLLRAPMSPRSATMPSSSARRPIGRSSATPPIMSSCTFPASIS